MKSLLPFLRVGENNLSKKINFFEILKGMRKKKLVEKEKSFQTEMLKHKVLGLDYYVMDRAATLLTELEEKGTPIAYGDLFIASTALAHDLILVTNNTFQRKY